MQNITRVATVTLAVLLAMTAAKAAPASARAHSVDTELTTTIGVWTVVANVPFIIANDDLRRHQQRSVLLGAGGVLVGAPSILLGLAVTADALGNDHVADYRALFGGIVVVVGALSAGLGMASIGRETPPYMNSVVETVRVTPVWVAADDGAVGAGLQLQMEF